jgi:hypothetical protein
MIPSGLRATIAPLAKRRQTQPRFILSLHKGALSYTCRGCKHQCNHVEFIVKHLQAYRAS